VGFPTLQGKTVGAETITKGSNKEDNHTQLSRRCELLSLLCCWIELGIKI